MLRWSLRLLGAVNDGVGPAILLYSGPRQDSKDTHRTPPLMVRRFEYFRRLRELCRTPGLPKSGSPSEPKISRTNASHGDILGERFRFKLKLLYPTFRGLKHLGRFSRRPYSSASWTCGQLEASRAKLNSLSEYHWHGHGPAHQNTT